MEKIIHFLLPRASNNYRSKILHTSSLFVISFLFLLLQYSFSLVKDSKSLILGYASNISIQEVVNLTNQKRTNAGLPLLTLNKTLSDAAYLKGQDMINKDYWSHTAPDGTEPWWFFNRMGYRYKVAGENLARDFSSAGQAVEAWMQSPTHKDNILNPKYKEIGIGVVEGDLSGSDTTIIVQFFGTSYSDFVKPTVATTEGTSSNVKVESKVEEESEVKEIEEKEDETKTVSVSNSELNSDLVLSKNENNVLISPFVTTKNTSIVIVSMLLVVFLVDWLVVSRKRIARITGKTFAHIAYLGMILVVTLILKAGKII